MGIYIFLFLFPTGWDLWAWTNLVPGRTALLSTIWVAFLWVFPVIFPDANICIQPRLICSCQQKVKLRLSPTSRVSTERNLVQEFGLKIIQIVSAELCMSSSTYSPVSVHLLSFIIRQVKGQPRATSKILGNQQPIQMKPETFLLGILPDIYN